MRPHNRLAHKSKRRSNPRRGKRKRGKPARVYFGGGICQNGAGREAARDRPGWSTASASRDAGTPTAGTVPALTMPTGTASRSAPPPAPGRTPPEPLPPVQTKGQSSSARRAVCPGLFLLPIFPPLAMLPARCTGSPAGSVRISDGPARSMTPPAPRRRSRSPRPPAPPARSRPTPTAPPAPHR